MFRANTKHLQIGLLDTVAQLSERRRQRLEDSWAGTFYHEITSRVDETLFAPLYSDVPSRPNIPIHQLFGIEVLKSGYGWSDAELFEHLDFDLQVRYALGVRDMETEICDPRTIYYFRSRVSHYMQAEGIDVFTQAFEALTDAQCAALGLETRQQRMDSTQLSSNIRTYSRLHLLVEVLQRAARMLTAEDQERYAAQLQPYVQGTAGQYCYRLKPGSYTPHVEQLGQCLAELLDAWAPDYGDAAPYRLLQRVFHEHFNVAAPETLATITAKPPAELSAASLQAPDDLAATYRKKGGHGHHGYVANVTETCAPENPVQLVTKLQVAPNTTADETLLCTAVPDLQARMPVDTLHADGGYNGPAATQTTTEAGVALVLTAISGGQPHPDQVGLADFIWETSATEVAGHAVAMPTQVTCPQGHTVPVGPGKAADRYLVDFPAEDCAQCPLRERCPTRPLQQRAVRVLRVTQRQVEVAQARQVCAAARNAGPPYLRPAVEATVRSLKHPFGDERGQLPVRGLPRVTMVVVASGVMLNLRRIWRYRQAEREIVRQAPPQIDSSSGLAVPGSRWREALAYWRDPARRSGGFPALLITC